MSFRERVSLLSVKGFRFFCDITPPLKKIVTAIVTYIIKKYITGLLIQK